MNTPYLILAPMEGVIDAPMRELLTGLGGIDACVSEFIRVSQVPVPPKVIRRFVPESRNRWRTPSGIPVIPQILGSDPWNVAKTARTLEGMGAPAVDLNFGCPAKTVNRHEGGASLLRCPEKLISVIDAVRDAIPRMTLSAKIRLGWSDPEEVYGLIESLKVRRLAWLTVHARTKEDGYGPAARWEYLAAIRKKLPYPLIANGDIAGPEDLVRCRELTGCDRFMIGRAAIQDPWVFAKIAQNSSEDPPSAVIKNFLLDFLRKCASHYGTESDRATCARFKQLTGQMGKRHPLVQTYFESAKPLQTTDRIVEILNSSERPISSIGIRRA